MLLLFIGKLLSATLSFHEAQIQRATNDNSTHRTDCSLNNTHIASINSAKNKSGAEPMLRNEPKLEFLFPLIFCSIYLTYSPASNQQSSPFGHLSAMKLVLRLLFSGFFPEGNCWHSIQIPFVKTLGTSAEKLYRFLTDSVNMLGNSIAK